MLEHWIINILCGSIAPLIYLCFNLYKDNKKQKQQIDIQNKVIEHLEKKYGI